MGRRNAGKLWADNIWIRGSLEVKCENPEDWKIGEETDMEGHEDEFHLFMFFRLDHKFSFFFSLRAIYYVILLGK